MDEKRQNKTGNGLVGTENELWLPPLSLKDQKRLSHLRRKGKKSASDRLGFANRTLWDWLQFFGVLAIPVIVAAGTLYFTQQITLQQAEFTQQQTNLSIAANERQHQTDLQIAQDQQREATLQAYLNNMSDLLLNHNLHKAKPGDEVSLVAREQTLTILRRLDAVRTKIVLQFLIDEHLVGEYNPVISLMAANFSGDDLHNVDLVDIDLSFDDFHNTNLNKAVLNDANLSGADFSGADLSFAYLPNARNFTQHQLDQVSNCKGAVLPKGLICRLNSETTETTGGFAHTWTNYTDAGGYEGPTIPANTTVQISCKIKGFVVADGNPWWYKIASRPWNYAYYASADAFYNNGQISGNLLGTPWVDPNIPDC